MTAPVLLLAALLGTPVVGVAHGVPTAASTEASRDTVPPEMSRDTVVSVQRGDVLVSETLRGTLTVRSGGDDEVRLSGDRDGEVRLVREGRNVRLQGLRGQPDVDLVLELPVWMPLRIRSREMDLSVTGLSAEVVVGVLQGDVRLEDLDGPVEARTVDGEMDARSTRGSMILNTNDGDVRVSGHRGELRVESTDGDLVLRDVMGPSISAFTLDGDVDFDGVVEGNGSLELSTHDGDVVAWVPGDVRADVEVSTFDGGFESEFPARTQGFRAGEPLRFQIGGGGARIALRSFSGDISIHSR